MNPITLDNGEHSCFDITPHAGSLMREETPEERQTRMLEEVDRFHAWTGKAFALAFGIVALIGVIAALAHH